MVVLTPGLSFLLQNAPSLFVPPALFLVSAHVVTRFLGVLNTDWSRVLGFLLSYLVFFGLRNFLLGLDEKRKLRELGAVRVPEIKGKWPWNVDLLLARMGRKKDGYPLAAVEDLAAQYGYVFSTNILGERRIITLEPSHLKIILATEFQKYEKGDIWRRRSQSVLGSGVFAVDGDLWKFHRSMSRPFFSRDRISDFETFERHSEVVLSVIRGRCGLPIDFQDLVGRFTLDSATEFLLGDCVHSLRKLIPGGAKSASQNGDVDPDTFAQALFEVQAQVSKRGRLAPVWPLFELFRDKTRQNVKILHCFINPIIQRALERQRSQKEADERHGVAIPEQTSLLDELVALTDDPKLIADETVNILIAGRDTTAGTLSFLVYLLTQHADVLRRLRNEVLQHVGPTRAPTAGDFRDMKFLRACINETLRLFPPVPGNMRWSVQATTLPPVEPGGKPFYIPAGTSVMYSDMVIHKRKDLWGPDADEFDPDRFLDERLHKYLTPNPFIFLPFNAGPRICLGQQFAYNEISYLIVRLLQAFDDIEFASDAQPAAARPPASWASKGGRIGIEMIKPKVEFTMYIEGGLHVRFREARTEV
ncbi:hypothetical protein CERSUDRAFT_120204 [Gelatoporia subvermispora B]|uniref:Cytochrome P450 n=1 Tax=Ceriporiopsis subvermispora (strain B) TaxID=914234 RepID=M2QWV9_CERS8|nr:hypothetical protein CERSUDRAFT_120204 [Gelatoporia subvermispora B]